MKEFDTEQRRAAIADESQERNDGEPESEKNMESGTDIAAEMVSAGTETHGTGAAPMIICVIAGTVLFLFFWKALRQKGRRTKKSQRKERQEAVPAFAERSGYPQRQTERSRAAGDGKMLRAKGVSKQGGRNDNEDSIAVNIQGNRCYAVVADGLGGHGGGKTASSMTVQWMSEQFSKTKNPDEEWLKALYEKANENVCAAQSHILKMKTTCVSLFLDGKKAYWAHVGDSRLYHFVNGTLEFCTKDHSVSQMAVLSGEITPDQIRFHEDRNRVLRAFGAASTVRPDIKEEILDSAQHHAFLLCTDGFWEYVLEGEMEADLQAAQDPSEWIRYMEARLRKRVKENHDNYSAVAVFYGPEN